MSIGNHELIEHIESCEDCQKIQDCIDIIDCNKDEKIQDTIMILHGVINDCYINASIGNN